MTEQAFYKKCEMSESLSKQDSDDFKALSTSQTLRRFFKEVIVEAENRFLGVAGMDLSTTAATHKATRIQGEVAGMKRVVELFEEKLMEIEDGTRTE